MAYSHFNGVRAHHNFFVCSWFIIVQNQSFVHKSFIWSQSKPYLQGSICTSISMAKTLCSHGSHVRHGCFRNQFPMLRYSDHYAQVHKPHQVLLSSHSNTSLENNFLEIRNIDKHFCLRLVGRIPNQFSGITNKDIYPTLVVNLFTYAMHTKI